MGATSDQWIKSTWSSSNSPKRSTNGDFPIKNGHRNSWWFSIVMGPQTEILIINLLCYHCYILLSFLGGTSMCHQVTWVCLWGPRHWSPHAIGNPNTMGESKFQMDWWLSPLPSNFWPRHKWRFHRMGDPKNIRNIPKWVMNGETNSEFAPPRRYWIPKKTGFLRVQRSVGLLGRGTFGQKLSLRNTPRVSQNGHVDWENDEKPTRISRGVPLFIPFSPEKTNRLFSHRCREDVYLEVGSTVVAVTHPWPSHMVWIMNIYDSCHANDVYALYSIIMYIIIYDLYT